MALTDIFEVYSLLKWSEKCWEVCLGIDDLSALQTPNVTHIPLIFKYKILNQTFKTSCCFRNYL